MSDLIQSGMKRLALGAATTFGAYYAAGAVFGESSMAVSLARSVAGSFFSQAAFNAGVGLIAAGVCDRIWRSFVPCGSEQKEEAWSVEHLRGDDGDKLLENQQGLHWSEQVSQDQIKELTSSYKDANKKSNYMWAALATCALGLAVFASYSGYNQDVIESHNTLVGHWDTPVCGLPYHQQVAAYKESEGFNEIYQKHCGDY